MKLLSIPLTALMLAMAASPQAAKPDAAPPVFLPDTETETAAQLQGSTWVGGREGIQFSLQLIDPAQRLAFINHLTGVTIDPFASPKNEDDRYLTFVFEIRNTGDLSLSFLPKGAWLVPDKVKETRSPTSFGELRFSYQTAGAEMPVAYERVAAAFYEPPVTVYPGDSVARLLVYKRLPHNVQSFSFDLSMTLSTGSRIKFTVPYAQPKKEKTKKKKS